MKGSKKWIKEIFITIVIGVIAFYGAKIFIHKENVLNLTYSCKITNSDAFLRSSRNNDLSQCFEIPNNYTTKTDRMRYCRSSVNEYMDYTYLTGGLHNVSYAIEQSSCP
jgi:hypothetical protein